MTHDSEPHSASDQRVWHGKSANSAKSAVLRSIGGVLTGRHYDRLGLGLMLSLVCASFINPLSPQAMEGTVVSVQPQSQQSGATACESDGEKDLCTLEPGKSIKRELAGGQQHAYRIGLSAGQFLKAVIEQNGIDVVVQVSGPDGKQILEFDSESRLRKDESVSFVTGPAGDYRLAVRPRMQGTSAGSYQIRIEMLRAATDLDRALHEARALFEESLKLQGAGKYDEALSLAERAREIRERLQGAEHPDVAAAINHLATIHAGRDEYAKAEPLFKRALDIREKVLGGDHPDTAHSLNDLASLYDSQGKYTEAEPRYKRALEIREKVLDKDHPDVAESLNDLGALYYSQGRFAEAEPLFARTLDIFERALGRDHLDTATALGNLALLYDSLGRYAEAEQFLKRSVEIREKALGKDHLETAQSLNNLAGVYCSQGKYAQAERLFKRALEIREKVLGKDHPVVALALHNLAFVYKVQERYVESERLYKQALEIREKTLNKDHPRIAISLNNLAVLYRIQGRSAEAKPLFMRALDIRERVLGKDHPFTAQTLIGLATLYRMQGKYAEAEPLYKRALDIHERAVGPGHPNVSTTLDSLAAFYMAQGDIAQAIKYQSRANATSEVDLTRNLVISSERDKLAYLATLSKQTDQTISLHLLHAPDDPMSRSLAMITILQRKARALDVTSENLNALRSRFNVEDQALLDQLTRTRSQLARLILRGPQKQTAEQYRGQITELEDQAERYEADISRRSNEFRAQSLPVTLEAVQAALPADVALIEFVTYRPFNAKATEGEAYGQPRYVAYVLRHNGDLQWKELGEAKPIDQAITAMRRALRSPNRREVKRLARSVDEQIFQPISPLLGEVTRVLVSPDGPLNLIPFAALVDEEGRYRIERYSISYLTSGRDLLRLQVARGNRNPPLVVADPDFGEQNGFEAAHSSKPNKGTLEDPPEDRPVVASARSAYDKFSFQRLPYTAEEGRMLRTLLPDATLLTKRRATKAAMQQVRSPLILHIATHGFFLEDLKLTPPGGRGYQAFDDDPERILKQIEKRGLRVESPLLRAGLALAGANEHKEEDNGILTAMEVTGLNLWGTKLVVLSACDTGVGEVRNGDGVHGLRRALVLAGSETQVMSLWTVMDKATRDLMVAYYRRLKHGEGRGEALRQVQLEMLKQVKKRHPYYWASFIQSGEWANLGGQR